MEKDKMEKEICPCCGKKMFKLNTGQWTHLFSKALEEENNLFLKKQ